MWRRNTHNASNSDGLDRKNLPTVAPAGELPHVVDPSLITREDYFVTRNGDSCPNPQFGIGMVIDPYLVSPN